MKNLVILCFVFALLSCSGKQGYDKAQLKEAYNIQKEILEALPTIKNTLKNNPSMDTDSLQEILHELEENLFEIPGYHLELPGHEGHDHSHSRVELTSSEMVEVNMELLDQIKQIKSSLNINE